MLGSVELLLGSQMSMIDNDKKTKINTVIESLSQSLVDGQSLDTRLYISILILILWYSTSYNSF